MAWAKGGEMRGEEGRLDPHMPARQITPERCFCSATAIGPAREGGGGGKKEEAYLRPCSVAGAREVAISPSTCGALVMPFAQ